MSEQKGRLIQIEPTQAVNERFKKREFVIEIAEQINGNNYVNYGKFQLVQNKCDILDAYKVGDMVNVHFNIKGNRWERDGKVNYITNLDAWRIERVQEPKPIGGTSTVHEGVNAPEVPEKDLPF